MKTVNYGRTVFVALTILGLCIAGIAKNQTLSVTALSNYKTKAPSISKAAVINQLNQLAAQVTRLEKNSGIRGAGGSVVYSAPTCARLYALYRTMQLWLAYLNSGKLQPFPDQWEGYPLVQTDAAPFTVDQALKVMAELKDNRVPGKLLNQFHIFLLPWLIPDISGLGGAGFALISAPAPSSDLNSGISNYSGADLAVILGHETGHHIHLSFMPEGTAGGQADWQAYLKLRGGIWHGPGAVNTAAWSNSSEETFAEDFRMLFGKEQPYFGDIALGDPRADPGLAGNLKRFMSRLGKRRSMVPYVSPWIPADQGLFCWAWQTYWLPLIWSGLGFLGLIGPPRLDGAR